jgi:hypothetical protein
MKLLFHFAAAHGLAVEGKQIKGPNGYIMEQVHQGTPLLAYALASGPALAFLHNSPEQCKSVLKAVGLLMDGGNRAKGPYKPRDGKVTVRYYGGAYHVQRWLDGESEVIGAFAHKKQAQEVAEFIRKQFAELESDCNAPETGDTE